jgi:transposase
MGDFAMLHASPYDCFVGSDIAAAPFVATWGPPRQVPTRPHTFAQTPDGFAALHQALAATGSAPSATLVVLEATGAYWVALAVELHQRGYHLSVVNPMHLHNYAKSLRRQSKTDALDAQAIWQFAVERQPPRWTPPPAIYHELRQRLVARDSLAEMRQQARNQRHALEQWPVVIDSVMHQFEALEADLDMRIAALDGEIVTVLQDGAWAQSAALLQSIPGIGPSTTAWVLVATLNFELCATPQAAVAYAGLNPLAHLSGTSVRGRAHLGRGGHGRLRKALYLASLSATQHNPMIRTFYARVRARGKPMKVARCAAARKLLQLAWAVVTNGQPFDPQYQRLGTTNRK